MTANAVAVRSRRNFAPVIGFCTLASLFTAGNTPAGQPGATEAAARCVTPSGSILRRERPDQPWVLVKEGEALPAGNLLIGLPGAALESADGKVRLSFHTDLSGNSPNPIIETAILLKPAMNVSLDFVLDRGRVVVERRQASGDARIHAAVHGAGADFTLHPPAAQVALELFGRWPAGVPFTRVLKPGAGPTLNLTILALEGEIDIQTHEHHHALHAPPGPALIEWDSVNGTDASPHRLETLPPWATAASENTPQALARKARLDKFRQLALEKSLDTALDTFVTSEDPGERRAAVLAMGALDDLKRLADAILHAKHPDVWENGVLALRHWIGRGPGQDQKLYHGLIERRKMSPAQAATVLQLLHSFGPNELARPETYEALINYLQHDVLAIRGLAWWHLVRLVPAGRSIEYSPFADKDARESAVNRWKELIPPGKLPVAQTRGEK